MNKVENVNIGVVDFPALTKFAVEHKVKRPSQLQTLSCEDILLCVIFSLFLECVVSVYFFSMMDTMRYFFFGPSDSRSISMHTPF